MNVALLIVGLLAAAFGIAVGLSGSRSPGDLSISLAVLVPGCAMAVAGYLGLLIERRRRKPDA
jgi:hypothetical protein